MDNRDRSGITATSIAVITLAISLLIQTATFGFFLGGLSERVRGVETGMKILLEHSLNRNAEK